MVRGLILSLTTMLVLVGMGGWLFPVTPALAQVAGPPVMEKPTPPPEEKKEEAPTTCGPMISDTCLPIETGKYSMQVWWALSFYPGVFSQNWRSVNAGGNFHTFYMPVKFTYGPTKNMEMYIIVPFIHNWANSVTVPGPNGETSANFSGIGDITLMAKYTCYRKPITGPQ